MLKDMYQAAEDSFSILVVKETRHQSKKKLTPFVNTDIYPKFPITKPNLSSV